MYLPQSVPLSRPHVAMWYGRSGKRYDFAVSRARPMWLGQPVVYVLVRYDGDSAVPLFVGHATAADPQLGGAGSEAVAAWEQAMALGMTHLHLRFEACSDEDRSAEVEDLMAAIRPPLNDAADLAVTVRASDGQALLGEPPAAGESRPAEIAPAPRASRRDVVAARLGIWLGSVVAATKAGIGRWRLPAVAAQPAAPGHVTVRLDAVALDEAAHAVGAVAQAEAPVPAAPPIAAASEAVAAAPVARLSEEQPRAEAVATDVVPADAGARRDEVRLRLGFGVDDTIVLFAGEIGWAAGVDLAVEAMATVHADPAPVRLLLAGEGPLRAELEGRDWHGGFAHACRFLGDLPAEAFAEIFAVCDAVVIPARAAQNPLLAEHALGAGKPVLTTHQAQLGSVRHGDNGLVTYDNPGSLVWGLREIRAVVARRRAPAALAA